MSRDEIIKMAQQEPVAWIQLGRSPEGGGIDEELVWEKDEELEGLLCGYQPLYTHPAPQQADRQRVPDVQEVRLLLNRFGRQMHRMGELWERCQGKGWPASESDEFTTLRDVKTPKTRDALIALLAAAPEAPAQAAQCWCQACRPITLADMRMVVCPDCGFKRCPKANDHRNACTGSNEPGQPGSAYPAPAQASAVDERETVKACLVAGGCKHAPWCSDVYCQEHCRFVKGLDALDALAELCDEATGGWDLRPSAVQRIGSLARKARAALAQKGGAA